MGRHKKNGGDEISTGDLEDPVIFTTGDDDRVLNRSNLPPVPPGIREVPEGSRHVLPTRSVDGLQAKKREPSAPVTIVDKRVQEKKATKDPTEIIIRILNQMSDVLKIDIGGIKYTGLNPRSIRAWIQNDALHLYIAGDGAEQKITVHGQNLESVREELETTVKKNLIGWTTKEK